MKYLIGMVMLVLMFCGLTTSLEASQGGDFNGTEYITDVVQADWPVVMQPNNIFAEIEFANHCDYAQETVEVSIIDVIISTPEVVMIIQPLSNNDNISTYINLTELVTYYNYMLDIGEFLNSTNLYIEYCQLAIK